MIPGVDLQTLIRTVGYVGIFAIVFAESGLLFGFFLPGDSLLFTAGFLASQGVINIAILVPIIIVAAITGDAAGYSIGYRLGRRLFYRENSLLFRREHLVKAEEFFRRRGGIALILARFIPIARTFTPIIAGAAAMPYPRFAAYNAIGGVIWGAGVTLAGYFLGKTVPGVDRYLLPAIAIIIVVSSGPMFFHLWRAWRRATTE